MRAARRALAMRQSSWRLHRFVEAFALAKQFGNAEIAVSGLFSSCADAIEHLPMAGVFSD